MLGQFDDSRFHLRSKGAKGYFRGALGCQGGGLTCINGYYGYFGGTENGTRVLLRSQTDKSLGQIFQVKVKLYLGPLAGELAAELPFTLMHPKVLQLF